MYPPEEIEAQIDELPGVRESGGDWCRTRISAKVVAVVVEDGSAGCPRHR